jgi:hypothetical protein
MRYTNDSTADDAGHSNDGAAERRHSRLDITLDADTMIVVPWHDEVVDPIGHDPRSAYVELFWLNVLGPTATWLLRRMVAGLDEYPGGYELDLAETARALGLSFTPGANSPFARAMQRCVLFGAAQPLTGGLAVRRRLPPVAARHLARMPDHLRAAHAAWRHRPSDAQARRAAVLASAMRAVGDDPDVVERQLMGLGVPPTIAAELAIHPATVLAPGA